MAYPCRAQLGWYKYSKSIIELHFQQFQPAVEQFDFLSFLRMKLLVSQIWTKLCCCDCKKSCPKKDNELPKISPESYELDMVSKKKFRTIVQLQSQPLSISREHRKWGRRLSSAWAQDTISRSIKSQTWTIMISPDENTSWRKILSWLLTTPQTSPKKLHLLFWKKPEVETTDPKKNLLS